jgi:hypothetical protein
VPCRLMSHPRAPAKRFDRGRTNRRVELAKRHAIVESIPDLPAMSCTASKFSRICLCARFSGAGNRQHAGYEKRRTVE